MIKNVLIICLGNICRSPLGEALFIAKRNQAGLDFTIYSAGIKAMLGWSADPLMVELLAEKKGIDMSHHRAQQATPSLLLKSDLILTMDTEQQVQLETTLPNIRGRVHRIGKWGQYDVPDPYKRPKAAFEQAFALIEQGVDDWYRTFWN